MEPISHPKELSADPIIFEGVVSMIAFGYVDEWTREHS